MSAMASPQKEHGHTAIANELMEALAGVSLNGTQFRLVMVILRKTYGWNKKMDTIGLLQFVEATGLPKKLVSRELNRLARRFIITAWGDDHHAKQYGVQKDYSRWLEDDPADVSTNQGTPASKVSTKNTQSVPQSVDKVSTKRGTTKDIKASKANTEATASGARPPRAVGGTLRQRFEADYRDAADHQSRLEVAARFFAEMLGPPNFPRLARLLKDAKSGAVLFDAMSEAARQSLTDDPHDYVAKLLQNPGTRRYGKAGEADQNSGAKGRLVL